MTDLLKRLSRLSGDNPVQWVKVTPDDWAELGAMVEDAERMDWLRKNALPGYSQAGTPWSIHCSRGNIKTWPELIRDLDAARNTTNEG